MNENLLISCISAAKRREMNTVFLVTWHSSRFGLHAFPIGRAGLATLRQTLSFSNQSKCCSRSTHGFLDCLPVSPPPSYKSRSRTAVYGTFFQLNRQARCASLWKSKMEEPLRHKAAQNKASTSPAGFKAIFGVKIDRKEGNDLLKRLQEHRHQGTLDQKLPYPDALIDKGLTYLRAKYPVDEDAAIIARIDREADMEIRMPQTEVHRSPDAVSQFDELRRRNRERREEQEAKQEMEKQRSLAEESPKAERRFTVRDGTDLVQLRPAPEWVQKYRDKAQMKQLPEMSAWARLLPSGLLTVAVVTLAVLFAQNYKQPSRKARLWPDLPPAAATVTTLIGVNVAVFVLWRLPPFWRVLNRNFLVVPAYPHSMSMLTACFSHQSFTHLLPNLLSIWLIGTRCTSTPKSLPSNTLDLTMRNSTRRHWSRAVSSSLLFQCSDCSIHTHGCLCHETLLHYKYVGS